MTSSSSSTEKNVLKALPIIYDGVFVKIFHGNYKNLAILFNTLEKKAFLKIVQLIAVYYVTLLSVTLTMLLYCQLL